jgi:AcrR family transcriptional regulator
VSPEKTSRGRGRPRLELDETVVLEAAVEVFANDGYFGATVDEIARRAGASKAILFRRYQTKDALFDLTVQHEVRFLTERLFRAYESGRELSVADSIAPGSEAILSYASSRPHGFRLLFQAGFTAGQGATPAFEKVRGLVTDRIAALILERLESLGTPSGPRAAIILASAMVGASEHVARLAVQDPGLDPEATGALLAEFLALGMTGLSRRSLAAPYTRTGNRHK